jgi:large exoprotein involved in heme utilization and adhesion
LFLSNGAIIVTSTRGLGNAGNILVRAETANLSGYTSNGFSSGLYTNTEPTAIGKGGEIKVNTNSLQLRDGAVINALTTNGNDGGNITINTRNFAAGNGGQVVTSTRNSGNAGNIILNASEQVVLAGIDDTFALRADTITRQGVDIVTNQGANSGLLANTDINSTGNGGSIFVRSQGLEIKERGGVTVSSQGRGVAGNIDINAASIKLSDRAGITGETQSSDGGNIRLQVQDLLLMRQNSTISTTAGTGAAPGNGGNIKINARNGFIVAVPQENNDIIANAFEGKGGFIDITALNVFGFVPRFQLTPNSDITAFSQTNPLLNGIIAIDTIDIDPTQGLVTLPSVPRSVEVVEGCQASRNNGESVRFVNSGRGGIASRPQESLNAKVFIVDWVDLDGEIANSQANMLGENLTHKVKDDMGVTQC